jgi:hypothetical protein
MAIQELDAFDAAMDRALDLIDVDSSRESG